MHKKIVSATSVLVGCVVLFGAGCGPSLGQKVAEKNIENALEQQLGGNADVNLNGSDGGSVVVRDEKTGEYNAFGTDLKIPDDFPRILPQYPGAKTLGVASKPSEKGASLVQSTTDDLETVMAWLEGVAKKESYISMTSLDLPQGKMRAYEKGTDQLTFTLMWDVEKKTTSMTSSWNGKTEK